MGNLSEEFPINFQSFNTSSILDTNLYVDRGGPLLVGMGLTTDLNQIWHEFNLRFLSIAIKMSLR